ncbi:hypothetical protein [Aeromonas enteropelogenes]|uniref:hypothetical protein n=1 Tax=Aeromonas enteropelogenes TaxID=29489 RepID=UPI003B9F0566
MNRKRWVGVLVVCALLAGLAWWVRGPQSKETNDTVAIGVEAETAMDPLVLAEPVASAALPVPELKPMPVAEKPGRLGAQGGYELDEPWQAAEVDADFPLAEPGEGVEQLQPIALQGDELGRAQIGDSVTLPLPDGSTLKARVTKVQLQRGGERNWQGEVQIDGGRYPVNFTVGKQATFGFIGTPQGSYSVETLGGKGWVYKNPPLDRGHGDNDGLIPTHQ